MPGTLAAGWENHSTASKIRANDRSTPPSAKARETGRAIDVAPGQLLEPRLAEWWVHDLFGGGAVAAHVDDA
jgi:hypothetical protein